MREFYCNLEAETNSVDDPLRRRLSRNFEYHKLGELVELMLKDDSDQPYTGTQPAMRDEIQGIYDSRKSRNTTVTLTATDEERTPIRVLSLAEKLGDHYQDILCKIVTNPESDDASLDDNIYLSIKKVGSGGANDYL